MDASPGIRSDPIGRRLDLSHQADHHAEDFERVFWTDDRISLVLGPQHETSVLEIEALQRELVVDDRHDDIALLRGSALFDDNEIALEDPGIDHRIAPDADEHGLRGALDQVVVERDGIRLVVGDRLRQARAHESGGERRRSGVDSRYPASFIRATIAATDDFERNPSKPPIDEYDGSARCRA